MTEYGVIVFFCFFPIFQLGFDFLCHAVSTGVAPQSSAAVEEQDFIGPLPSELSHEPDYLLALSWLFVSACAIVAGLRSTTGRHVWNTLTNHAHLHID